MKNFLFGLIATMVLAGNVGCARLSSKGCQDGCNGNCSVCGMSGIGRNGMTAYGENCDPNRPRHFAGPSRYQNPRAYVGPAGPPTAAVTYPYYTTRGPRDFFQDNPLSIGP